MKACYIWKLMICEWSRDEQKKIDKKTDCKRTPNM
jgi:hypothetical protein